MVITNTKPISSAGAIPQTTTKNAVALEPAPPVLTDTVEISTGYDDRIKQTVTIITSVRTGEVIQELPPDGMREFAVEVRDKLAARFEAKG